MSNPYHPPKPVSSSVGGSQPAVIFWYRFYLVLMCLVYVVASIGSGALALFAKQLSENREEEIGFLIQGVVMAIFCVPFAIMFGYGLMTSRNKFGWIWGIILIAIGMTSPCCLPVSIPLLIFWLKEDNKVWHNLA